MLATIFTTNYRALNVHSVNSQPFLHPLHLKGTTGGNGSACVVTIQLW